MYCGSDFVPPKEGSRERTFTAVCIWDYDGRKPPAESEIDTRKASLSLGAGGWLERSVLGSLRPSNLRFWKVIDERFVVGATSEEVLALAVERQGRASFLDYPAIADLPGEASEVVCNEARKSGCLLAAYLPTTHVYLLSDPDWDSTDTSMEPVPFHVGARKLATGRWLPNGWLEYRIPAGADENPLRIYIGLDMLNRWGLEMFL